MKTFKILVCALFVICGGIFVSGCGKQVNKDFDISKIVIDANNEFVYDGKSHAVGVSYKDANVQVSYALDNDKNNFKTLEELNTINVGTYNMYYRLSANGYNDYTSSGTLEITIVQKDIELIWDTTEYVLIYSNENNLSYGYHFYDSVNDKRLDAEDIVSSVSISGGLKKEDLEFGQTYELDCEISDPNYNLIKNTSTSATLTVKDYVHIDDGTKITYYSTIQDALKEADDNNTIVLNSNVYTKRKIDIDKNITIDGQGKYSVIADYDFEKATYANKDLLTLFNLATNDAELTLKDVTINGVKTVRCVSAFHGKVNIDNATIKNGKKNDNWRSGGVFITNDASFTMTSGTISENDANDTDYTKYCADLWIGANAMGSLVTISGGKVGNVFVNSNSFSAKDAGKFVLDGGIVENIYVEYDSGYGAKFDFENGEISNLLISLKNNLHESGNRYGVYYELTPVKETQYTGGQLVYSQTSTTKSGVTYGENIDNLLVDENNYIFENCVFNAPISTTKKCGLVFNNCTFNTTDKNKNLEINSASNVLINACTFNGVTTGVSALDVNVYSKTCEDVVIINNKFNTTVVDDNLEDSIVPENIVINVRTSVGTDSVRGKIDGEVLIANNAFVNDNCVVNIGSMPQHPSTTADKESGNFNLIIEDNLSAFTLNNLFNYNTGDVVVGTPIEKGQEYSQSKSEK